MFYLLTGLLAGRVIANQILLRHINAVTDVVPYTAQQRVEVAESVKAMFHVLLN